MQSIQGIGQKEGCEVEGLRKKKGMIRVAKERTGEMGESLHILRILGKN